MAHDVSKLTELLDAMTDDDATTLAGILFVAEAWASRPRRDAFGRVIQPERLQTYLRQRFVEMQRPSRDEEG